MFDRPDERQVVFERMDWTHPQRRGYYEKNKAFIAESPAPLAEMLTEDPIQVMFNGSVDPMRALVEALRAIGTCGRLRGRHHGVRAARFSLVDVNAPAARRARPSRAGRRAAASDARKSWPSAIT